MAAGDLSMAARLTVLAKENSRLRYRQIEDEHERRQERWRRKVNQAFEDAKLLVGCAFATLDYTRQDAPLSERRWTAAVALLRVAGLTPKRGQLRIRAISPETAAGKLALARDRAIAHPELLNMHLPSSRRLATP